MKTTILKYITVTFAAGAMLLAGCNDLDQEPTNKFTDKAFWTSPERANMVLNMAYNQMFGHDKIWQDEALSDNLYEQRGNPDTRTIRMGQATPNTGLFRSEWKWVFEGVKTCNVFMNFVDEVPGMDPERLAGMKAQIRFIRAFLYFRLANFYGDIPFFLQDISLEESRRVSRTPYPEVMSALHRELDEIVGDLPTRDELKADDNGRITKAAAMVLKARMYMYENVQRTGNSVSDNMRKAADICDKLIHEQGTYGTYSLLTQGSGDGIPAYEYLFTSAAEYNSEVILDYAAVELNKQWSTLYSMVPLTMGANLCQKAPTRALVDSYLNADGSVPADKTVYANRDPRLTATVVYNGYVWKDRNDKGEYVTKGTINVTSGNDKAGTDNGSPTGFYTRKYFDTTHGKNLEMWTNIIMMRYADVLLMYAEAKAYLNEMDAAVWNETIKPIRQGAERRPSDRRIQVQFQPGHPLVASALRNAARADAAAQQFGLLIVNQKSIENNEKDIEHTDGGPRPYGHLLLGRLGVQARRRHSGADAAAAGRQLLRGAAGRFDGDAPFFVGAGAGCRRTASPLRGGLLRQARRRDRLPL